MTTAADEESPRRDGFRAETAKLIFVAVLANEFRIAIYTNLRGRQGNRSIYYVTVQQYRPSFSPFEEPSKTKLPAFRSRSFNVDLQSSSTTVFGSSNRLY